MTNHIDKFYIQPSRENITLGINNRELIFEENHEVVEDQVLQEVDELKDEDDTFQEIDE